MFPRSKRLSRSEFPRALSGRRVSSAHFIAVIPKETKGYAVVVPKKVARLSLTRHRIRRRTLEALRTLSSLPPSLILFPKLSVVDMTHEDVRAELVELFSKIKQ